MTAGRNNSCWRQTLTVSPVASGLRCARQESRVADVVRGPPAQRPGQAAAARHGRVFCYEPESLFVCVHRMHQGSAWVHTDLHLAVQLVRSFVARPSLAVLDKFTANLRLNRGRVRGCCTVCLRRTRVALLIPDRVLPWTLARVVRSSHSSSSAGALTLRPSTAAMVSTTTRTSPTTLRMRISAHAKMRNRCANWMELLDPFEHVIDIV